MSVLRLRYVHSFTDQTGRLRHYFRYKGQRFPLPGIPGSVEFAQRYDELRRQFIDGPHHAPRIAFGPGTLGWLIEQWLSSKEFAAKAAGTQYRYRKVLDAIRDYCGRALIVDLREHHVRDIRARFLPHTSTADHSVMLLSMLWIFAKEHLALRLGLNPTMDIQKLHRKAFEHELWPDALIEKFEAEARPKPNMALALLLLLYTGQRVGDVARMTWAHYDGEGISVSQHKTHARLWIPCHVRLQHALKSAARKSEFILTTQMRGGYTPESLSNMVATAAAQCGGKGYSAHGLRKNAASKLAEAGCSPSQIAAITGHATLDMIELYTKGADQRRLARQAIDKLETADKLANSGTSIGRRTG